PYVGKKTKRLPLVAGGIVAGLLLLAGLVIILKTKDGTLPVADRSSNAAVQPVKEAGKGETAPRPALLAPAAEESAVEKSTVVPETALETDESLPQVDPKQPLPKGHLRLKLSLEDNADCKVEIRFSGGPATQQLQRTFRSIAPRTTNVSLSNWPG